VHVNRLLCRLVVSATVLLSAIPFSSSAVQESGPSEAAMKAGPDYMRALESAGSAFATRHFSVALEKLDLADQIHPDVPDTWRMRGAIYAEQRAYEKAEDAFEKEKKLNPGDFWGPYNLAELLLVRKKYVEATAAFQDLLVYRGHEELIQFKIVFADALQGKSNDAKRVLDAMKFPSDTPAYYFANAAYSFSTKDEKKGKYWIEAGLKVFGIERSVSFYDALVSVGWAAMRNPDGSVPQPSEFSTLPAASPVPGLVPQ
jgi:tetratricopeptide (TPR) repeat protein